jgi:hypothetical protein
VGFPARVTDFTDTAMIWASGPTGDCGFFYSL